MKKKLTLLERATVALTTTLALAAGFTPIIMRAAANPGPELADMANDMSQVSTLPMRITAFSSSVDETDSTPFITANGTYVHDGIVASNLLPFGTKIQIPALFGEKVFTVEDRMAKKFQNTIDVWMSSKGAALRFGVSYADVVIVGINTSALGAKTVKPDLAISKQ